MPSPRSSSRRSSKSSSRRSSSSSKKAKTRKRVRINSPLNQVHAYSLSPTEKANKRHTARYKACPKYPEEDDFPCSKAYTVFENMHEYEQHKDDFELRDHSKRASIRSHYSQMKGKFALEGKLARKIPQEYRLYDTDTGAVHDIRHFGAFKKKTTSGK
jgi:hypothetical protein